MSWMSEVVYSSTNEAINIIIYPIIYIIHLLHSLVIIFNISLGIFFCVLFSLQLSFNFLRFPVICGLVVEGVIGVGFRQQTLNR